MKIDKTCTNCGRPCEVDPAIEIFDGLYLANTMKILCIEDHHFMWSPIEAIEKELFEL